MQEYLSAKQNPESKNWHGEKLGPTVALISDKRHVKINDYSVSFVPFYVDVQPK